MVCGPRRKRGKIWFAALRRRKKTDIGIREKVMKMANSEVRAIATAGALQYCPIIAIQRARLARTNVQTEAEPPTIARSAADLSLGLFDNMKTK